MPVNLSAPDPKSLLPVAGVALGIAEANIRKPDRKDLLVIRLDDGAQVAGVFTQNRFCAAPVVVTRQHLSMLDPTASIRALVVNTGNANAGTGKEGLAHARQTCAELARLLGCAAAQVLPFSTGVIMEPLPVERIAAGLPACIADCAHGQLVQCRAGDHDHRHAAESGVPPGADRRGDGDDHRHRQGRGHDTSRTWRPCSASSRPTRA